ncbi:imidazoleglycerol-phosphate dehydratase HisB [Parasporobacterium paucivorans]|uniref:Imidazoleglycerol-phosphate dehydratase n=1 Tax=Parasporobacterium paucivorans DSM 15970 TaxID=1122934 RepID=A0A1M6A629_9FIRM|nr:imidazoleglycerol-phosphate dehydratase HisB [Parasporobacterium paucivorans]SHI31865.1 imidazoleglycerol-phosphate dehydratase [Parasporobacterium paucivorans DSM 15970]
MSRTSQVNRKTSETDISITLDIDGTGISEVDTGIGFFDHMLNSFAKHGLFNLRVKVTGDLHIDSHHTIEDTGIALGTAVREALGDKESIRRYGSCILPMDETLMLCSLDLSGRPYLGYEASLLAPAVGDFDTEMLKEFFYAVTYSAGMNLHIRQLSGENCHHIIEAAFKSFARALDDATRKDDRITGIPSTKGILL